MDQNCDTNELCFVDADNDGYRLTSTVLSTNLSCNDSGEAEDGESTNECNDADPAINGGAAEIPGDEVDQNCDTNELCYVDADNDGYRLTSTVLSTNLSCNDSGEAEDGESTNECDDADPAVNGGATEIPGDEFDQNCDTNELCYVDADNDGYRLSTTVLSTNLSCNQPGEAEDGDPTTECNDSDPAINGGAAEITGDNVDQNCDGDEMCWVDADNDTYRLTTTVLSIGDTDCLDSGEGVTSDSTDECDDTNSAINGGASEITGDGVDQNCDGVETCYVDFDNDNYRLYDTVASGDPDCSDPGEALTSDPPGDCNDSHAGIYPSVTLPEEPGSSTTVGACLDSETTPDGYCLGGGRNLNPGVDSDCQDIGEDMGSFASGIVADCDETTDPTTDPESVLDFTDNDADGLIDELCFGNGELVVTEYYSDDSESEPDWFEVMNVGWFTLDINGWRVDDGATQWTIDTGTNPGTIAPGDQAVLCHSAVTGVTCMDTWGAAFGLDDLDGGTANAAQEIVLRVPDSAATITVDIVDFSGANFTIASADTSHQLTWSELSGALAGVSDPDNNNHLNWADTTEPTDTWSAGTGTPGADNQ